MMFRSLYLVTDSKLCILAFAWRTSINSYRQC